MNLIKSFNKDYLKENIKKSKGLISLFLILVPLFTAIVTIFVVNQEYNQIVVDKFQITTVNLIGMYVIPFVLSFALFGYVYKKTSVDFINSMPINRKTIFTTNTIGGIILITVMQLITAIVLMICDIFCSNIIIFSSMIADIFLLMWSSYIFVFLVANLAMSLSGTFLTQMVLSLLIMFLIPFCIDSFNEFDYGTKVNFVIGEKIFEENIEETRAAYTLPYNLFSMIFNNQDDIYSTSTILRMIILGVFYFIIGLKFFEKRKMENNEESFSSVKMHQIVKGLTIFPMIILLNAINAGTEFNVIVVALILVYYFIFDFVVRRKVSLKVSIFSAIVTLVIIQGIYGGTKALKENFDTKEINRNDIVAVSIGNYRYNQYYSYAQDVWDKIDYVENEELINKILESAYKASYDKKNMTEQERSDIYYGNTTNLNVYFKTKFGKIIKSNFRIYQNDENEILKIAGQDEKYMNALKEYIIQDGEIVIENLKCNEQEKNAILQEIKEKTKDMSIEEFFVSTRESSANIYKYYYRNHKLVEISFPIDITDKTFEICVEKLNINTKESLEIAMKEDEYYSNFHIEKFVGDSGKDLEYISFDQTSDEIVDFILKNYDEKIDINKPYYIIRGSVSRIYGQAYFFTNKVEEINEMIAKEEYRYRDYEMVEY